MIKQCVIATIATLFFITAFGFVGCTKSAETKAQELIDIGMHEQAKTLLNESILKEPKNAKIHYTLGKCLLASNDFYSAQESFNRAKLLDKNMDKLIGRAYYDHAIKLFNSGRNSLKLFVNATRYDPSLNPLVSKFFSDQAINWLNLDSLKKATYMAGIAILYQPSSAEEISSGALERAKTLRSQVHEWSKVLALAQFVKLLKAGNQSEWGNLLYKLMVENKLPATPKDLISIGELALEFDKELKTRIHSFYLESGENLVNQENFNGSRATIFLRAAVNVLPDSSNKISTIVWNKIKERLSNLRSLGKKNFTALFNLLEEIGVSERVKDDPLYLFAKALKLYIDGNWEKALAIFTDIAENRPKTPEGSISQSILAPPPIGRIKISEKPFHFKTYDFHPGWGKGVDIKLLYVDVSAAEILLTFSVKSIDHKDILIYSPKNIKRQFYSDCEKPFILDDNGNKLYTTTGFIGGSQKRFHSCAIHIQINPGEDVIITAKFPMVSRGASKIKFVSPKRPNVQEEWTWENIRLKKGPFD